MAVGVADTPDWVSSSLAIGGVISIIVVGAWRGLRSPVPVATASRNDLMDVFVREQGLNREILTRIAASNEAMVAIMESSALEDRIAREITNRLSREKWRDQRPASD